MLCITAKFGGQCLLWVKSTHYRAAAFLSAPPQQAERWKSSLYGEVAGLNITMTRAVCGAMSLSNWSHFLPISGLV